MRNTLLPVLRSPARGAIARSIARAIAVTGPAALLAATPALLHAQQGRDEATWNWSKQLAAGTTLVIRNGDGPISVREASSDRVEVRAVKNVRSRGTLRDVAFDVRESGDQVEVCTLYEGQSSCRDRNGSRESRVSVEYTVLIPRSIRLRVATGNGAVSVERAGADLSAATGNGRITIGQTEGRVDASTGNGDVDVAGANGPVKVSTGNGRVSVATGHGAVTATTGNGDIDVRIKSLAEDTGMSFTSGSGSIRVSLPADFNGRIDATSGSGSLRSDFEISILGRLDAHHVRGTIGKGGALLRLSTGSGEIELRKS